MDGLAGAGAGALRLEAAPFLRRIVVTGAPDRPWATPWHGDGVPDGLRRAAEAEVVPADLLMVIFTSGSTAAAKGVVHTHGTVVRKVATGQDATGFPSTEGLRVFAGLPFFWIGGIQTTLGALHSGATLVCQDRFDPAGALDLIEAERVDFVMLWPTLRQRLEHHAELTGRTVPTTQFLGLRRTEVSADGGVRTNLGMTESMGPHATGPDTDHRIVDAAGQVLGAGVRARSACAATP